MIRYLLNITLLLISFQSYAQQFSYKPMNPFFGGDTFNYQVMLSSASAQNPFDNSSYEGYKPQTTIGSFQEQLNRQILNRISNGLFGSDYNQEAMEPGVYNYGSMNITIAEYFGGINIRIIDILTGEQTDLIIPNM